MHGVDPPIFLLLPPPGSIGLNSAVRARWLYARILAGWFDNKKIFPDDTSRLFLLLWGEAREGQRQVEATSALAGQAGVSPRSKGMCLRRLERPGAIRVERQRRKAPVITVLIRPPIENDRS